MTGQIPKYGDHFRLERAQYDPYFAHSHYVLKRDGRWFIVSDKTSKRWFVMWQDSYLGDSVYRIGKPHTSLRKAMDWLTRGIDGEYLLINSSTPFAETEYNNV